MAQWIYLNQHNRSVLAHRYSVLSEKNWPYPPTASWSYDRQTDEVQVNLKIFKLSRG